MIKAGFIGTGNMGSALAAKCEMVELLLANRTRRSAEALAKKLGGQVVDNMGAACGLTRADAVELVSQDLLFL